MPGACGLRSLCRGAKWGKGPQTTCHTRQIQCAVVSYPEVFQRVPFDPPTQTSALGPGSGASWLAVACGLLVGRIQELLESGVPHHCIREGMLQAVSECCDVGYPWLPYAPRTTKPHLCSCM